MSRLHLVEGPSLGPRAAAARAGRPAAVGEAELLAAAADVRTGEGDRVLLVGSSADASVAAALGVRADLVVAPPLRRVGLAARSVVGAVRALAGGAAGSSGVEAWSPRLGSLARRAVGDGRVRARHRGAGGAFVLAPAGASREAARAALALSPGEFVFGALADPPRLIDARRFAFLAGVLDLMERRVTLLVPEAAGRMREAAEHVRTAGLGMRVVIVRGAYSAAHAACDALLLDDDEAAGAGGPALAALGARAEAAGVRVVRGRVGAGDWPTSDLRSALARLVAG